jgi:hypothetical protein
MYRNSLLLVLLVIQLLLVGLVSLLGSEAEDAAPLIEVDPEAVTGLTISDAQGGIVRLSKTAQGWRLAGDLPADSDKIVGVIETLAGDAARWPVATSTSSQERFEVTEDAHQRRIRVDADGETVAEVFLGTSPGFRRVHAREADSDAVYSIDFAVHEVPTDRSEWLNRSFLQTEGVVRVTLPEGGILARNPDGNGWLLGGATTDSAAVTSYVERLEGLSVLGLYEGEEAELGAAQSVVVEDAQGSHRLTFRRDEDDDEYVLTSDRFEGNFNLASYIAEQILIRDADLLPAPTEEPSPGLNEDQGLGAEPGVSAPDGQETVPEEG